VWTNEQRVPLFSPGFWQRVPINTVSRVLIGQYLTGEGLVVSHLNISSIFSSDGGLYTCRAANTVGTIATSARLNVYGRVDSGMAGIIPEFIIYQGLIQCTIMIQFVYASSRFFQILAQSSAATIRPPPPTIQLPFGLQQVSLKVFSCPEFAFIKKTSVTQLVSVW
jgi:hypothetical protein